MSTHSADMPNDASHVERLNPPLPLHDDVPLAQRLLMRPEEAATLLGVGRSMIYELLRAGKLPAVHIGRTTSIPVRALVRWIERQTGE